MLIVSGSFSPHQDTDISAWSVARQQLSVINRYCFEKVWDIFFTTMILFAKFKYYQERYCTDQPCEFRKPEFVLVGSLLERTDRSLLFIALRFLPVKTDQV